jgi:hypothetical protein
VSTWSFNSNGGGNMAISTGSGEFLLAPTSGNLTIAGTLITGGGGTCDPGPCDGTFKDYTVESIEDHATYMWENSHLWGVGPTPEGALINVSKKVTGILHELEKAHIYIEQLNDGFRAQQDVIEELRARLAELGATE